jgi:hypothetical protein
LKTPFWHQGWYRFAHRLDSPNFGPRPVDTTIDLVVIHAISLPPGVYGGHDVQDFFTNQLVTISLLILGLIGVLFMWQGKRLGFHLYILYSIGAAIQYYLFVSPADIPSFLIIWNVLIILTIYKI